MKLQIEVDDDVYDRVKLRLAEDRISLRSWLTGIILEELGRTAAEIDPSDVRARLLRLRALWDEQELRREAALAWSDEVRALLDGVAPT